MKSITIEHTSTSYNHAQQSSMGMDRQIKKEKIPAKVILLSGIILLIGLSIVIYYIVGNSFFQQTLQIDRNRLKLAKVKNDIFEDFIPVRASVAPLKTVFLDAVQGGRVEEILVEDGATVKKHQALLKLSNSDLQLSVMSTESRVMEQLNVMRDQELRLEQNRLNHKNALVELDYSIRRLTREIRRKKELLINTHLSRSDYDDMVDELRYNQEKRNITTESQASDEKLMTEQLKFLKEKNNSMEQNLAYARKSLQDLTVRAPVTGSLSGFDMQIGQNVSRGLRIGQVSIPNEFKLVTNIDEYYLDRIVLDQRAYFDRAGQKYQLRIAKIYPDIRNGQFQVDLKPIGDTPADLRRGQNIQLKLILGNANKALLVPNGQFFQDTGGNWIFVISEDGSEAYKRKIRLGQRNNRFIEVLAGLEPNEEVIVSSYSTYKEMDRIKLN